MSLWSSTPMFVYAVDADRDCSGLLCVCTSSVFVYVTQIGIAVCLHVQYVCVCDADRDCSGLLCVCLKRNGQYLDACFKTLRQC